MKFIFQKTTLFLALWLAICLNAYAQHVNISGSSKLNLSGTVKLRVAGSSSELLISDNASINDDNTNSIIVEGDFSNESGDINLDGALIFNGTTYQYFYGTGTIATLTVSNEQDVDIEGPLLVNSNLNLGTGNITTIADDDLTINHDVTISGAGADSYVDGPLRIRATSAINHTLNFPIGTGTTYKPARIHFTQIAVNGYYVGQVYDNNSASYGLESTLQSVSTARYWEISSDETVTSAYIELPVGTDDGVLNANLVRIARADGGQWTNIGGINIESVPGTVRSSSSFNSFGEFTIASALNNSTDPIIYSITPDNGYEGDLITISGAYLGNSNGTIRFDDVTASASDIVSWSDDKIEVKVPIGLSPGSNVNIEITVSGGSSPIDFSFQFTVKDPSVTCSDFSISTFPISTDPVNSGDNAVLAINVNDPSLVDAAGVYYRGISQEDWLGPFTPTLNDTQYSYEVSSSVDDIGIEYYYTFSFADCNTISSNVAYTYIYYPNGVSIPGLTPGDEPGDYDLFSIPLDLDATAVTSVFDELGSFDKSKWRVFRIQSGDYQEYNSFSNIDLGRGYLILYTQNTTSFNSGAGTTVTATKDNPFSMSLQQGWNMIASPYLFTISWEDVLSDNGIDNSLENFHVYTSTGYQNSNGILDAFEGAIYFAESAENVDISVIKDNSINGRIAGVKETKNPLDNENWQVKLNLTSQAGITTTGGFGMSLNANESKDAMDAMLPPKIANASDFYFNHQEYFYPYFSKDIVPKAENYEWSFEVNPAPSDDLVTFSWENDYFGENDKNLYLLDEANGFVINMRNQNTYAFNAKQSQQFKVIYGDSEKLNLLEPVIGAVYPNPTANQLYIPLSLPTDTQESNISINLYDLSGRLSGQINMDNLSAGYQLIELNDNGIFDNLSRGMYAMQIVLESDGKLIRKNVKLMID
ncbi:IPT/TIG domain-containing protein [Chondrinema litorale]|uniref:IPT/TIG domain-containing protein n=1 Tax=Chondrinema litorale TaxID=2994555 RepID=UPI00254315A5|nr:IPT/TIG domain-containing protein [Chondrinema litorale]UZR97039.1 IPT/TIG domain-containing protein [Chondrinema litorale]